MRLELTLLPIDETMVEVCFVLRCNDRLHLDRDYAIFRQLIDLTTVLKRVGAKHKEKPTIITVPLPDFARIESYDEYGIRHTGVDKTICAQSHIYAEGLKKLKMPANASPKNLAIKAFLDALPDKTTIILQWSKKT